MISEAACHGRLSFAGRPPAGTDPWAWWWSTFAPARVLIYAADIGERSGETKWSSSGAFVVLHYKLTEIQRRAAVAHEMHHLAVGGVCRSLCRSNEAKVRKATARWLLPDIEIVADKLRIKAVGAVALDLGVPSGYIWDRIEMATPTERKVLGEVFGRGADWVAGARAADHILMAAG